MWDPDQYRTFRDHRDRPARELLDRVGVDAPRRIVDLGCGTGNLLPALVQRWPHAILEAVDSSPEMVRAARAQGFDAEVADVRDWMPAPDTDLVVTNAVLQWVPEHVALLDRWLPALPSGSWFAMQVPGNFTAASHRAIRELAGEPRWRARLRQVGPREDPVLDATGYGDVLTRHGFEVDAWETVYLQVLTGEDPVLRWVTGTALTPVRQTLDDEHSWDRFRAELAPRLRSAYPRRADGSTWFPFRRIFAVGRKTS